MPLEGGDSKKAFSHNVAAEVTAGKPQKQAVAIAYAEKRAHDAIEEANLAQRMKRKDSVKRDANSAQYEAAMQKFRAASAAWRQAQADYRSRKSGDKEFLTAKAVFKKAEEEADLAEAKEKRSDGEMCKSLADRADSLAKRFDAYCAKKDEDPIDRAIWAKTRTIQTLKEQLNSAKGAKESATSRMKANRIKDFEEKIAREEKELAGLQSRTKKDAETPTGLSEFKGTPVEVK